MKALHEQNVPTYTYNQSQGFYIGADTPPDHPQAYEFLRGPNQWPDLPPQDFRDPIMQYRSLLCDLTEKLLRILSVGLDTDEEMLETLLTDPVANLKLLHYPPTHLGEQEKQFGG